MNEEIYDYQLNQLNQALRQNKFILTEENVINVTNQIYNVIKKVIDKVKKTFLLTNIDVTNDNKYLIYKELKRSISIYMIPKLLRIFRGERLRIKQWLIQEQGDNKVEYNNSANILVVNGTFFNLNQMQMEDIERLLIDAIQLMNPEFTSVEISDKLAQILNLNQFSVNDPNNDNQSKFFSSLAKFKIFDNMLIMIDNLTLPPILRDFAFKYPNGQKEWLTKKDNRVRRTHKEIHGKKIGVLDYFNVGGFLAQFPKQNTLPPKEKIKCRCWLNLTS